MSCLMRSQKKKKKLHLNLYVTAPYIVVTLYTTATRQLSENSRKILPYMFCKVDLYKAVTSL